MIQSTKLRKRQLEHSCHLVFCSIHPGKKDDVPCTNASGETNPDVRQRCMPVSARSHRQCKQTNTIVSIDKGKSVI